MALKLASLSESPQEHEIANFNIPISALCNKVISPGLIGSAVMAVIEAAEVKDVVPLFGSHKFWIPAIRLNQFR
jgi:hypothetical protein